TTGRGCGTDGRGVVAAGLCAVTDGRGQEAVGGGVAADRGTAVAAGIAAEAVGRGLQAGGNRLAATGSGVGAAGIRTCTPCGTADVARVCAGTDRRAVLGRRYGVGVDRIAIGIQDRLAVVVQSRTRSEERRVGNHGR